MAVKMERERDGEGDGDGEGERVNHRKLLSYTKRISWMENYQVR